MNISTPTVSTYEPNKRSIGSILSTTSPDIIVPTWQRSYSWKRENVETFWNDLIRFEKASKRDEYFLGSLVIVRTSDGRHELLDGQQRLATSAILLSAIREQLKTHKADAALRMQAKYLADFDDSTEVTTYKLTLNKYDNDFFKSLIMEYRDGDYTAPVAKIASHRLIESALKFFEERLDEATAGLSGEDSFKRMLEVQRVLTNEFTTIAIFFYGRRLCG